MGILFGEDPIEFLSVEGESTEQVVVSALASHVRGAGVVTLGKFLYTNCLC